MAFKKYRPCDDCGARNLIDSKFCSNGGKSLEEDGEESQEEEDLEIDKPVIEKKIKVGNVDDRFVSGQIPTKFEPVSIEKDSNRPFTQVEKDNYVMNSLNEILKILRG